MFEPDPNGHASAEGRLPEPVDGVIAAAAIIAAAAREGDRASGLPEQVEYRAYESDDRRFAWLHAVPKVEGEGIQFFALTLDRDASAEGGWAVSDVDGYDSPEDARIASAREWVSAQGGPELPTEPVADFG